SPCHILLLCFTVRLLSSPRLGAASEKAPLASVANPGLQSLLCRTISPPKGPAAGRCAAHTEEAVTPTPARVLRVHVAAPARWRPFAPDIPRGRRPIYAPPDHIC